MSAPLTRRQRDVLDFLAAYIQQHGYAPTLAEIKTHFGLRAITTVHAHLAKLARKGYLKRSYNAARGIALTVPPQGSCPTCGRVLEAQA